MTKKDDKAAAPEIAPQAIEAADPHAGGSYARDPATGALICATPATLPPPAMRKTQDPVTGRITKTPAPE